MRLEILWNYFKNQYAFTNALLVNLNNGQDIRLCRNLNQLQNIPEDGCLYVGSVSELSEDFFSKDAASLHLLLTDDDSQKKQRFLPLPHHLICLPEMDPTPDYIETVAAALADEKRRPDISDLFMDMLLNGDSIQAITEAAGEILKHTIFVNDISYYIIARFYQDEESRKKMEDMNVFQIIGDDAVSLMHDKGIFTRIRKESAPVSVRHPSTQQDWLFESVYIHATPVADIAILADDGPLQYLDYMVMDILKKVIGIQLQKDDFFGAAPAAAYTRFLNDIIYGRLKDSAAILMRARTLDIPLHGSYCMMVTHLPAQKGFQKKPEYLRTRLTHMIPGGKWVANEQLIFALVAEKKGSPVSDFGLTRLSRFAEENDLTIGISDTFYDLMQIPAHYKQAEMASNTDLPGCTRHHLRCFSDVMVTCMLRLLSDSQDHREWLHPSLLRLEKYDAEHNSDLMHTLEMYLAMGMNTARTSEALNIHRNTLLYRIHRINDLIDLDPSKTEDYLRILLHFKIRTYEKTSGY